MSGLVDLQLLADLLGERAGLQVRIRVHRHWVLRSAAIIMGVLEVQVHLERMPAIRALVFRSSATFPNKAPQHILAWQNPKRVPPRIETPSLLYRHWTAMSLKLIVLTCPYIARPATLSPRP